MDIGRRALARHNNPHAQPPNNILQTPLNLPEDFPWFASSRSKGGFLPRFLGLIWLFCTQKPVCFLLKKQLSPVFSINP
jgi:hypothetical protein